jgi:hypothetical protein
MTIMTSPKFVLDVFPATSADLRRRLQEQVMGAKLPGGLLLEDSPHGATYQLEAEGDWSMAKIAGEWHFSHSAGHIVVLGNHGITLRPAN